MKGEPSCVEAMLSHAIKVEAFEQSLGCRGSGGANTDSDHSEHRPGNAYAVSDQKGAGEAATFTRKWTSYSQH